MTEGVFLRLDLRRGDFHLQADLALPGRGVTALFGPSGSGKTTILRALAGLERIAGADIRVNGEVWQDTSHFVPTHQRPLGYVLQESSLFAHLSVLGNLEFGMKRIPLAERRIELGQAVALMGIAHLLARKPDTLSGGERQRVGIARALLTSPRILLMDEPLAALDRQRKAEILPYLEKLHEELDIPVVYVSHSPEEAARLADYLVLIDQGRIIASGPLAETLGRLDLPARFHDSAGSVINAKVAEHDDVDHLSRITFAGGELWVNRREVKLGHAVRCRIDSRDVSIARSRQSDSSILNMIPARITDLADTDHPARMLVRLDAGGTVLFARITRRSARLLGLAPGQMVWAQIKAVALLND